MKIKGLLLAVVMVLCLVGSATAEQTLTTSIVQPTIDRFVVEQFSISNKTGAKMVQIVVQYGYDNSGTFEPLGGSTAYTILNSAVKRNNRNISLPDNNGEFPTFPAAYQTNPADEVISQALSQSTPAATLSYLETVVKQLGGL